MNLTRMGYEASVFNLNYGDASEDKRISLSPKFGNDYSKIQVMGHLATQIVLIIHKPVISNGYLEKMGSWIKINKATFGNVLKLINYSLKDKVVRNLVSSKNANSSNISVELKSDYRQQIKINKGEGKTIFIEFKNNSAIPLFGLYGRLREGRPIVLVTINPNNRISKFVDKTWPEKNRLTTDLWIRNKNRGFVQADYVLPKQNFAFRVSLNTNNLEIGKYSEEIAIIQEPNGWIANSSLKLEIEVV